jgi:hypothetical protein
MIKRAFYSFILCSALAWSQTEPPTELLLKEAVEISQETLNQPIEIKNPTCSDASSVVENSELTCVAEGPELDIKDFTFLHFRFASWADTPSEIKALPGATLDGNTKGSVQVVIGLPNDNKMFGLWGLAFKTDGDDEGYTHGTTVDISKTLKNNITLKLNGQTHLYTQYDSANWFHRFDDPDQDGKPSTPYKFTNEAIIKIVADNVQKQNVLFWKAGVGWTKLDNQHWKSILTASGQQFRWHNLIQSTMGEDMATDPVYMVNEDKFKQSLNLEAFVGLQKNLVFGQSSCRLKLTAEMGGQVNSVGSSFFKTEAGTYFFYQKSNSNFNFMMGASAEAVAFKGGTQLNLKPGLGVQKGRFQFGLIYNQTYGKLNNYASYNTPNEDGKIESIMTMNIGFLIGRFNHSSKANTGSAP